MRSLKDRFDEKVVITPGCWLWSASVNSKGYGLIRDTAGALRLAHRVAYELYVGPVPAGRMILHRCDVPACVNPFHLRPGTAHENTQDMLAKGRGVSPQGEVNGNAKLTGEQVRAIRSDDGSLRAVARKYGVTYNAIDGIRSGKTWRSLDSESSDDVVTSIHQEHQ
ncbi:HNH endonuclease signature motif containing protein [Burkholderia ubonensis]|uniref:HNH endonuclease signature motif containing protein n=1 Tax=Burkholderia ubonensis TaxID=101571 RepID=UPI0008FE989A|nr:HNH endonuclease signature motif containing protein [Burkholderia ubonensis]OJB35399.1 hypothetical protein BGV48_00290 [Burkholderia ubonensis]